MNRKETMSNGYDWVTKKVNFWHNKKLRNFDEKKKRKLLRDNISKMKAVNKFCESIHYMINKPYKNGQFHCLTPVEKLDSLQRFCDRTQLRNNDVIKASEEELVKTCVSGVSYE
jgi:hypothetical protein